MGRQGNIYVVDDDPEVRESSEFFLKSVGYAVRTYRGGRDFITDVPHLSPGCVMLDIRMPGRDGFDVLTQLAERAVPLRTIVVTGHGDVATAVQAMKLGASDFMEKPYDEDQMLEILDIAFSKLTDDILEISMREAARTAIARLTERELDVLRGLIAGRANKVLAFDLGLSVRTVEMYRANMMERLGVRTLPEALRTAFRAGLIPVDVTDPIGRASDIEQNGATFS